MTAAETSLLTPLNRRLFLALLIPGLLLLLVAVLGPHVGLGNHWEFLPYEWFGVSRRELRDGAQLLLALAGLALVWRHLRRAARVPVALLGRAPVLHRTLGWLVPSLAMSAITLAIFFGIAESYMRLQKPFFTTSWPTRFDPAYGFTFLPGKTVRHTNHVDFWQETRANSLGFLDREPPVVRPADGCRVLFLGDSFVEAAQVPIEQKLQVVFEDIASEQGFSRPIQTLAMGISGTGQTNQLAFYDYFGQEFDPDVVVFVWVNNDLANNSSPLESVRNGWHPFKPPRLFFHRKRGGSSFQAISGVEDWSDHVLPVQAATGKPGASKLQALHGWLHPRSLFYRWLYSNISLRFPAIAASVTDPPAFDVFAYRLAVLNDMPELAGVFDGWNLPQDLDMDTMFFAAEIPEVFEEAVAATEHTVDAFLERGEQHGFRLLALASYGLSQRFGDDRNRHGRSMVDNGHLQRVSRLLASRNVPLIDQHAYLISQGGSVTEAHFSRDGHWSEQGHRWAAEALWLYFKEHPDICGSESLRAQGPSRL